MEQYTLQPCKIPTLEQLIIMAQKENLDNVIEKKEPSKEERISYHKGALDCLIGEHNELLKMVGQTENLIRAHLQELEKLGVKIKMNEGKK